MKTQPRILPPLKPLEKIILSDIPNGPTKPSIRNVICFNDDSLFKFPLKYKTTVNTIDDIYPFSARQLDDSKQFIGSVYNQIKYLIINKVLYSLYYYDNSLDNIAKLVEKINVRYALEQKNPNLKQLSFSWYHRLVSVIMCSIAYNNTYSSNYFKILKGCEAELQPTLFNVNTSGPSLIIDRIRFNKSLNTINLYPGNGLLSIYVNINIYDESVITSMTVSGRRYRSHRILTAQKDILNTKESLDKVNFIVNNIEKTTDAILLKYFKKLPIKKINRY